MSKWVYNVEHTIQQVGGKRWPNGILIRGIYSWVGPDDIVNKSTHPQLAEEHQEAKRRDAQKEQENPVVIPYREEVKEEVVPEKQEETPAVAPVVEEQPVEEQPVIAPVVEEQPVEEQPVVTPVEEEPIVEPVRQEETPVVEPVVAPVVEEIVEELPVVAPVEEQHVEEPIVEEPVVEQAQQEETPAVAPVVAETVQQEESEPVVIRGGKEEVEQEEVVRPEVIPQCDRFTIGARAGLASLMHDAGKMGKWHAGFDALLDLQYAHYWKKDAWKAQYGILVGLSAGYSRSHIENAINDKFTETTVDGQIDYTIKADKVKEYDGQIQLEVPVMFSVIHDCGLFFNFGPRFSLPVYAHYNQKISDPDIIAYFPEEDVTVYNAKITGQVTDNQAKTKGKWNASKINVMLGAELGYEIRFASQNTLGIGVYANYSVYTLYTNNTDKASLVTINELPAANKPAVVNVLSATDTYNRKLGYFDVGLKLAYHFNRIRSDHAWIAK